MEVTAKHQFSLSDPRWIWVGILIGFLTIFVVGRPIALMLVMAAIVSFVTAQLARVIGAKFGLSYGWGAGIMVGLVSIMFAGVMFLIVPLLVVGLKQIIEMLPKDAEHLRLILEAFEDELKNIIPAEKLEEILKKIQELGVGKIAGAISAEAAKKIGLTIAHFFLYCVFYLMIIFEWDEITSWISKSFERAFPRQSDDAVVYVGLVQHNLLGICKGISKIMLVFVPYYAAIFAILGVPIPRAAVYGLAFGLLGGIPLVGGLLMYPPMWIVGFIELAWPTFELSTGFFKSSGAISLYILIVSSIAGHILEAKFVTPKLVGKEIHVSAIVILVTLLTSAIMLGLIKGLVMGFTILACFVAWNQLIDKRQPKVADLE